MCEIALVSAEIVQHSCVGTFRSPHNIFVCPKCFTTTLLQLLASGHCRDGLALWLTYIPHDEYHKPKQPCKSDASEYPSLQEQL